MAALAEIAARSMALAALAATVEFFLRLLLRLPALVTALAVVAGTTFNR
jgi:hypothetical protein